MLEPAVSPVPNGGCFPGAPAVHHNHCCFFKSRICVSADRMRQVVAYKSHPCLRRPENLREPLRSSVLMPHAQKMKRGIQSVQVRRGHFSGRVTFQIVAKRRPGNLPAEAHFVELLRLDACEIQARSNRILRESRVVLGPADAFFRHCEHDFAVAHQACCRIMHLRIINPQRDHANPVVALNLNLELPGLLNNEKRMELLCDRSACPACISKNAYFKLFPQSLRNCSLPGKAHLVPVVSKSQLKYCFQFFSDSLPSIPSHGFLARQAQTLSQFGRIAKPFDALCKLADICRWNKQSV